MQGLDGALRRKDSAMSMTSRERMETALSFREPDRVPIEIMLTPTVRAHPKAKKSKRGWSLDSTRSHKGGGMQEISLLKTAEEIQFSWMDRLFLKWIQWWRKRSYRALYLENQNLKARMKKCGKGVWIHGEQTIAGVDQVEIGDNVHIAAGAFIKANGGLKIGSHTHISRNLLLYTVNHDYTGKTLPYDAKMTFKPVTIGRNVWIGMNVCIAPGTEIGDGCIIGMGAVVSGKVPPLSIIGNQKWRTLAERDAEHYKKLDEQKVYGAKDGHLYEL